jgi:hypothetical protein
MVIRNSSVGVIGIAAYLNYALTPANGFPNPDWAARHYDDVAIRTIICPSG